MFKIETPNLEYLAPDQKQRFIAMEMARNEMETITAKCGVRESLIHNVGKDYSQYEFGDNFMVHKEDLKHCDGLFTVHSFDNNRTVLLLFPPLL